MSYSFALSSVHHPQISKLLRKSRSIVLNDKQSSVSEWLIKTIWKMAYKTIKNDTIWEIYAIVPWLITCKWQVKLSICPFYIVLKQYIVLLFIMVFSSIWGNTLFLTQQYNRFIKIFRYFTILYFEMILLQELANHGKKQIWTPTWKSKEINRYLWSNIFWWKTFNSIFAVDEQCSATFNDVYSMLILCSRWIGQLVNTHLWVV